MLAIHKSYLYDESKKPVAVQIPIGEFRQIEEALENYGLTQLIKEVEDESPLSGEEALSYYKSLKAKK